MEVTFIICNYNYGEYIEDAINSALNQDVLCNVCIIDDLSTDDSRDVVHRMFTWESKTEHSDYTVFECSVKGKSVMLVEKVYNDGPSESRNIGIELTKDFTDIYAILDADDQAYPSKVSTLLPYFYDKDVGVVYADYTTENSETGLISNEYKKSYCIMLLHKQCIVHSGSLIRKTYLEMVKDNRGYYDKSLRVCEDYDLWLRLSKVCMIKHHPEQLTHVLITPKNSTNSVDKLIWQQDMGVVIRKNGKQQIHS